MLRALLTILVPALVSAFHARIVSMLVTGEQISRSLRRKVFAWGATGAIGLSLAAQIIIRKQEWPVYADSATRIMYEGAVAGPLIEECAKALPLLLMLICTSIKSRRAFLAAGILSGSGFFFTESTFTLMGAAGPAVWTTEVTGVCLVRGFNHSSFSGLSGIGFGIAARSSNLVVKTGAPLLGLAAAFLAHAINNALGVAAMHGMGREATGAANRFALLLIVLYLCLFVWLRRRASRHALREPSQKHS